LVAKEASTTLQIVITGRGGQGAQLAGNLLAMAFFAEGREVQCFATYGGARRGTPVSSFIRVDDRPIRVRCDIEQADALLCFDASLLTGKFLAAARPGALIVVNSSRSPAGFAAALPGYRVLPVDGLAIAQRKGLGRIVNSALLGAFARALEAPALDTLSRTIADAAPKNGPENTQACVDGYRAIGEQMQRAAA
jgi:pyruvate ferredoxin oxidoreductase gamma subunit